MLSRARMFWMMLMVLAIGGSSLLAQPTTVPGRDGRGGGGARRGGPGGPSTQGAEEMPAPSVTEHELTIAGGAQPLKYKATAGFIPLKDGTNRLRARVFYIAYEQALSEPAQIAQRPITFVFNGGPGAAAIWLHLGTAGPKRVTVPLDGSIPAPPYQLQDNPYSWLDFTDLVCIDPVGTGFSRAEEGREREFYN